jgi:integrase
VGKVVLSKRTVDAFSCPDGRKDALLFDAKVTGFALRATSTGNKVFILQYKRDGRVRRLVLGEYGTITSEQARSLAEQERGMVKAGKDPRADRLEVVRAERASRAAADIQKATEAFTFKAMIQQWHDEHLVPNRSPAYAGEALRALKVSLPGWQASPAGSITAGEAGQVFQQLGASAGPGAARHAFRYAYAAFSWAEKRQLVSDNPLRKAVQPTKAEERDRALTDAELGTVWRASAGLGHPYSALVRILILTLQRRGEVVGMKWEELSPDLSLWTMPAGRTKNRKRHIVHLAPEARAIIGAQPRFADCPLVFTTTGKGPIRKFSQVKRRLDANATAERREAGMRPAELPPWHLHDLRRTGVTGMAAIGILTDVADRILNHQATSSTGGVKGVYQVHAFSAEREEAMRAWASHVLRIGAAGPPPGTAGRRVSAGGSDNVVSLAARRK